MKTRSLTTLITLSVSTLGILTGYYFTFTYVSGLAGRTAQAISDLAYAESKYTQALSLNVVANSGQNEGKKLDAYLINKGEEISVVKDLERLATGLSLVSTTDNIDSQDGGELSVQNKDLLHIVMSTNGLLQQTRKFLALIETLPYNVRLNKIDLYDGGSESTEGRWRGRFDISIVKEKDTLPIQ